MLKINLIYIFSICTIITSCFRNIKLFSLILSCDTDRLTNPLPLFQALSCRLKMVHTLCLCCRRVAVDGNARPPSQQTVEGGVGLWGYPCHGQTRHISCPLHLLEYVSIILLLRFYYVLM